MKVEKDEFLIDTAESLQWWRWDDGLWQTVPDLSCGNWKGTAANSGQFDGRMVLADRYHYQEAVSS